MEIKRGQIYLCDLGVRRESVQGGYRPVLVVQNNRMNTASKTILVAPITSVIKKEQQHSHIVIDEKTGLDSTSMVLLEQICVVNKTDLKKYVGQILQKDCWKKVNKALMQTFGLRYSQKEHTGDVRCLCKKHLDEYKLMSDYIIRRFEPTQRRKDKCDKCNNLGYDYLFFNKKVILRKGDSKYGL